MYMRSNAYSPNPKAIRASKSFPHNAFIRCSGSVLQGIHQVSVACCAHCLNAGKSTSKGKVGGLQGLPTEAARNHVTINPLEPSFDIVNSFLMEYMHWISVGVTQHFGVFVVQQQAPWQVTRAHQKTKLIKVYFLFISLGYAKTVKECKTSMKVEGCRVSSGPVHKKFALEVVEVTLKDSQSKKSKSQKKKRRKRKCFVLRMLCPACAIAGQSSKDTMNYQASIHWMHLWSDI